MADETNEAAVEYGPKPAPAVAPAGRPKVLVHAGVGKATLAEIDWPDVDAKWDPKAQPAHLHIGGEPFVQIGSTADGTKVYAHEDVKKRA